MTTPTREQVVQCDDIREAFERRFKEPPFEFSLELYGEQDAWPGSYKKYSEQCAWDGYKEARADLEAENAEAKSLLDAALDIADAHVVTIKAIEAELESLRKDAVPTEWVCVGSIHKSHLEPQGTVDWCKEILLYSPENKGDSPNRRVRVFAAEPKEN